MGALALAYDDDSDTVPATDAPNDPLLAVAESVLAQLVPGAELTQLGRGAVSAEIGYRRRAYWHVLCYRGRSLETAICTNFRVEGFLQLEWDGGAWVVRSHKVVRPSDLLADGAAMLVPHPGGLRLTVTAHPERYGL